MTENGLKFSEEPLSQEVATAFKDLTDAAVALDLDRYFALFDEQRFTSLNADGTVFHEFSQFEKMFRSQIPAIKKYQALEFSNVKITILSSDTAVLVNEYSAELSMITGDVIRSAGAGTQIWSKTSGEWLLIHISSSTK